jgi:hypothetical protein
LTLERIEQSLRTVRRFGDEPQAAALTRLLVRE